MLVAKDHCRPSFCCAECRAVLLVDGWSDKVPDQKVSIYSRCMSTCCSIIFRLFFAFIRCSQSVRNWDTLSISSADLLNIFLTLRYVNVEACFKIVCAGGRATRVTSADLISPRPVELSKMAGRCSDTTGTVVRISKQTISTLR